MNRTETNRYRRLLNHCRWCLALAAVMGLFTGSLVAGAGFHLTEMMLFPLGVASFAAALSLVYAWAAASVVRKVRDQATPAWAARPASRGSAITTSDVRLSSVGLSNGVQQAIAALEAGPALSGSDNPTTGHLTTPSTESEVRAR